MASRLEIHELSPPDLAGEAAFRAASPQRTPFAGAPWVELLAGQLPGRFGALAVTAGGERRALLPFWERRDRLLGPVAEIPPLTPYWGPLLAPAGDLRPDRLKSRDHEALEALAAEFRRRWRYGRLLCHPSLADARPLTWAGMRGEVRYTSLLSPQREEGFLASLPSSLRNKIRQGEGLAVEESTEAEAFVALYGETFGRRGMEPPVTAAFVRALASRLGEEGGTIFYLRNEGGETVAGRMVLWEAGTAYDLLAAAGEAGRGPLGAYLLWREVLAVWERGLTLDLVGVNVASLARFKESFGGRLAPYHLLASYRSPLARLVVAARRRGRG
jgi:hypothetical protein